MNRHVWLVGCLAAVLSSNSVSANAHITADAVLSTDHTRETLKDLTGVQVIVEPLPQEAEQDGLRSADVQEAIETQLQHAGIRVLTAEERRTEPGFPFLYVSITTVKTESIYSYALAISLNQTVHLTRHPTIATFASTWSAQASGAISASHVGAIADHVQEFVGRFVSDYQAMNPADR